MTVTRWHSHADDRLRLSGDTIDMHQARVAAMCISLAAFLRHPLHDSDLPDAALHHDDPERVLGDMPGPCKDRFPALAAVYAEAEAVVMAEMGLSWSLTPLEASMLDLADKTDAYIWAVDRGVTGPEWDAALTKLRHKAAKIGAYGWLQQQLDATP